MRIIMKRIYLYAAATAAIAAVAAPVQRSAMPRRVSNEVIEQAGVYSVPAAGRRVTLQAVADGIIRVGASPDGQVLNFRDPRLAVLSDTLTRVSVTESPDLFTLSTSRLKVCLDRNTGRISFLNLEGDTIAAEAAPLDNTEGAHIARFANRTSENWYGAGERGHAPILNGDSLSFYNRPNYGYGAGDPRISQTGISIPFIASDAGYGILFDDPSPATLLMADTISYASQGKYPLSYFFIDGEGTLEGTTKGYTALTGRQDLPPFWTLGYVTSKYGYRTQQEALGAVDSLKTRGYPLDGIVFDLYWYGTETDMGCLEWNLEQFPDPKGMLDSLKAMGVQTVLIHQPYINKKGAIANYDLLAGKGLLVKNAEGEVNDVTTWVGDAGMFDMANPDTRQWLWQRLAQLTADGVAGWWGDLGEPEVHPLSMVHADGSTASEYHNYYGNQWSEMIYEGLRREYPDMRPMLMMRGGTAGLQRYSVFPWTGDVARSWGGLQAQVNLMLSAGISGLGYMSSDLGGFAVNQESPTDAELYARWLEMGAFTPFMRTHAQLKPEPYHYPEIEKITHEYIDMRYRWLPYNYTLAYENATKGWPLARPLNFSGENPGSEFANVADEYMWGDEVLVAPVMEAGAVSREVLFPKGEWIDWWNPDRRFSGPGRAEVEAPLEVLPLFVKAGSFIPQYEKKIENTGKYEPSSFTILYFPSDEASSYTLYDDDRLSPTSIADGRYRLLHFEASPSADATEISISSEGNGYEGMPATTELSFRIHGLRPSDVTLSNGTLLPRMPLPSSAMAGWWFDEASSDLCINVPYNGTPLSIRIAR